MFRKAVFSCPCCIHTIGLDISPKKGYGENLIELGKLFYDLGKLVFGGDVLTILLDYRDDKTALLVVGVVVMVLCFVLGWILIARGNRIKNIV